MATLAELARAHTTLDNDAIDHLQRLARGWSMLADLCFGDLVLLAPTTDGQFVVLGQMRPSTSQTLHHDDLVGRVVTEPERPVVGRSFRSGEIVEGEVALGDQADRVRMQGIPVRSNGQVIAVMTREATLSATRRPGALERVYGETFERFARMIVRGEYPFVGDDEMTEDAPRVGDGAILLVRRPAKGLLGGMAALPGPEWAKEPLEVTGAIAQMRHVFTHFALELSIVTSAEPPPGGWWQPLGTIGDAGLPTLYRRAVEAVLAGRIALAA